MRRILPPLSMSGDTSAVKSVPYVRSPATGLVAPLGRKPSCAGSAGFTGALVDGLSQSLMIFTELAPIEAASSGRVKLVSRLAVVDQPSCEFSAACIAALRHGTVGKLSVPSGSGAAAEGAKYRSIGYGKLPVAILNFAIASSTGGGGDSGPSLDAWHPASAMPAKVAASAGANGLFLDSNI